MPEVLKLEIHMAPYWASNVANVSNRHLDIVYKIQTYNHFPKKVCTLILDISVFIANVSGKYMIGFWKD